MAMNFLANYHFSLRYPNVIRNYNYDYFNNRYNGNVKNIVLTVSQLDYYDIKDDVVFATF